MPGLEVTASSKVSGAKQPEIMMPGPGPKSGLCRCLRLGFDSVHLGGYSQQQEAGRGRRRQENQGNTLSSFTFEFSCGPLTEFPRAATPLHKLVPAPAVTFSHKAHSEMTVGGRDKRAQRLISRSRPDIAAAYAVRLLRLHPLLQEVTRGQARARRARVSNRQANLYGTVVPDKTRFPTR